MRFCYWLSITPVAKLLCTVVVSLHAVILTPETAGSFGVCNLQSALWCLTAWPFAGPTSNSEPTTHLSNSTPLTFNISYRCPIPPYWLNGFFRPVISYYQSYQPWRCTLTTAVATSKALASPWIMRIFLACPTERGSIQVNIQDGGFTAWIYWLVYL